MFDKMKDRIRKDKLANDLLELGRQIKITNEETSVVVSPTVGVAATKALELIKSIEGHLIDLAFHRHKKHDVVPEVAPEDNGSTGI